MGLMEQIDGAGWIARRTDAGCTLSWDGGGLASQEVEVAISTREFERLRTDPSAFMKIALRHDPHQPGRNRDRDRGRGAR